MKSIKTIIAFSFAATVLSAPAVQAQTQEQDVVPVPTSIVENYGDWRLQCFNIAKKAPAEPKDGEAKKEDPKKKGSKKKEDNKGEKAAAKPAFDTICEVVQSYRNSKSNKLVARLIFTKSKDEKDKGHRALLETLVDLSFEKKPAFVDGSDELLSGEFATCRNQACYMTFDLNAETRGRNCSRPRSPVFSIRWRAATISASPSRQRD